MTRNAALAVATSPPGLRVNTASQTAALLPYPALIDAVGRAAAEHRAARIDSPERTVLPLGNGGVFLSMPAAAQDVAIHKLVNVHPGNAQHGLPTIQGIVAVCDAGTGTPLCLLDGPEVTGRRTAAVSLLAIRTFTGRAPTEVLLIGTGVQARHHLEAVHALYPRCVVWIRGKDEKAAAVFRESARSVHADVRICGAEIPRNVSVVIALTTSTEPVYDEPASAERLVIGVGAFRPEMAEIGKTTLEGSDVYADDAAGARHEAGDLLRAGVDWQRVRSLGAALELKRDSGRPVVFKSVGTAAWDLAAARVALEGLGLRPSRGNE